MRLRLHYKAARVGGVSILTIMNIRYVTQILNGKVQVSDQEASLSYNTDDELAELVVALIDKGYAFTDEPAGWPPAAIVQMLKDKGLVRKSFTAITWSGPGEHRAYKVV